MDTTPFDFDGLREECGVFGVFGHPETIQLISLGLFALQHRGQEGAGIVTFDGETPHPHRGHGLVSDVFQPEKTKDLRGSLGIGHVRYSTSGNNSTSDDAYRNLQPLFLETAFGGLAVAHNGNLTNSDSIRKRLLDEGKGFISTVDTEVILQLIAASKESTLVEKVKDALSQITGSYSLIIMTKDMMIGVRDPFGFRPLKHGELNGATIFSSETCALDSIGAKFVDEVAPGEMLIVTKDGVTVDDLPQKGKVPISGCVFEHIYFARPDSLIDSKTDFHAVRIKMGQQLAKEVIQAGGIHLDYAASVPDSGIPAAYGFSEESGVKYQTFFIRNHYVGRTFIAPDQINREKKVRMKFNPRRIFKGESFMLIDDSMVRGTTSKIIVAMAREADLGEVHMGLSSPMIKHPCHFGIDTPDELGLIAHNMSHEEMVKFLGVDSLTFLSLPGLVKAIGGNGHCTSCFTGDYPVGSLGK